MQSTMTYTVVRVRVEVLGQEQFQNALREGFDFLDVCYARIRDRRQAMRIPTNTDSQCRTVSMMSDPGGGS
jgi:hypothetical protein